MNLFLVCAGFLLPGVCLAALKVPVEDVKVDTIDPNDPRTDETSTNIVWDDCVEHECCDDIIGTYDLVDGTASAQPAGFEWITTNPNLAVKDFNKDKKCAHYGTIKVNFEAVTELERPCNVCVSTPWWGRRMLKLELKLHPTERGLRLFNIGDSKSNNGDAGDSNHQFYDAEIDADYPDLDLWQNDVCRDELNTPDLVWRYDNALATGLSTSVNTMTIYIANQMTRVKYAQYDHTLCSKCMFGLNNYVDMDVNNDIYISFNSVIKPTTGRFGYGLCSVRASWVCPQVMFQ